MGITLFKAAMAVSIVSAGMSAAGQTSAAAAGSAVSVGDPLALTFYIAPKHTKAAEAKAQSIQTPGSPDYHKFLTVPEFVANYTVSDAELKSIKASLQNLGFTIGYVYPNHLAIEVLGSVGVAQNALGVQLKHFERNGVKGFASVTPLVLPAELRESIRGVGGLNTMLRPHPMRRNSPLAGQASARPVAKLGTGDTPGNYLPADFAKFYDVKPIYDLGFKGRGSTVGIVTLNDFNPADAYSFWSAIGLTVSPTRITKVDVDGGIEATTNNSGNEVETDLDVEYSGGLAPQAKVRVYIAPVATNYGFENAFETVASENVADTVSTSWGQPELDYFPDPTGAGDLTPLLQVYHDVFLEMALQGQTMFAASGDSGSFDTVEGCPAFGTPTPTNPVCNAPYAVESPSNDPLVTAAGGTTLPFSYKLQDGATLSVSQERAWGWDYIASELAEQGHGADAPLSDVFSVGGGGGVSSYFPKPWYQTGVKGIRVTEPAQFFSADFGEGSEVLVTLPSGYAGRNMPDISAGADPESGYILVQGGMAYDYNGGTSFVAPQLNGVTALFVEALGARVGQINPALYQLGEYASTDIKAGDNWGYAAHGGYDDAAGLGTLDAGKLLVGLEFLRIIR